MKVKWRDISRTDGVSDELTELSLIIHVEYVQSYAANAGSLSTPDTAYPHNTAAGEVVAIHGELFTTPALEFAFPAFP